MFLRILLNVKSCHIPATSLRNCKKVRNVQNTVKLGYLVLISVHYGEAIKINFKAISSNKFDRIYSANCWMYIHNNNYCIHNKYFYCMLVIYRLWVYVDWTIVILMKNKGKRSKKRKMYRIKS